MNTELHLLTVDERNAQYEALPKNLKRVAIAKDALYQLQQEKLEALSTYLTPNGPHLVGKIKELLDTQAKGVCRVCATGALVVGKLHLDGPTKFPSHYALFKEDVCDELADLFTVEELALIEACFEVRDNPCIGKLVDGDMWDEEAATRYMEYGLNYLSQKDRLTAILENIIEHDGNLVVE